MYEVNCGEYASRRWDKDSHGCWYSYCVGMDGKTVSAQGYMAVDAGSSGSSGASSSSGLSAGGIVGIVCGVLVVVGMVAFVVVRKRRANANTANHLSWDDSDTRSTTSA